MNLTNLQKCTMQSALICITVMLMGHVPVRAQLGIWTTAEELSTLPMDGPAWEAVLEAAGRNIARPRIANQNNKVNVYTLAAAIVYARTGQDDYRQRVVATCEKLARWGDPGGRTLAWARGVGAYALAADLVGYRTPEFESWLRKMADEYIARDKRTLRAMFEERPNNWGAHAFGSLCAVYRYLGDFKELNSIRDYWSLSVTGPNPGLSFGHDSTWHADPADPLWINPKGAMRDSLNVDGLLPDDMRRGGSLKSTPTFTKYAWEGLQGLIMAARILERAKLSIWAVGDSALYRASNALQERLATTFGERWQAGGDDSWLLPFLDKAYGTEWAQDQRRLWKNGKSAGWGYVTLAPETPAQYNITITTIDSGTVAMLPPGGLYYAGTVVTLVAKPHGNGGFMNWGGDATGEEQSVTLVVDSDKHVTAEFAPVGDPEYTLTLSRKGSGGLKVSPDLELFASGMEVTLTATPNRGFRFKRWEWDGLKHYDTTTTIIMNTDKSVRAIFQRLTEAKNSGDVDSAQTMALGDLQAQMPTSYGLFQNYPNPFNPETEIRFQLPQASRVELHIYNALGQKIRTLADGQLQAGQHKFRWDGRDKRGQGVATGVYFYRLRAGEFTDLKKMNLLR